MSAVRGISQYQQAMFTGFGGTTAASGGASSRADSSVQAKVVTKTIGFQLGKFGISYASEELEVDSGSLPKAVAALSGSSLSSDAFASELDVASVRDSLSLAQSQDYASAVSSDVAGPTALTRRLGTRAYAQADSFTSQTSAPSMFRAAV